VQQEKPMGKSEQFEKFRKKVLTKGAPATEESGTRKTIKEEKKKVPKRQKRIQEQ